MRYFLITISTSCSISQVLPQFLLTQFFISLDINITKRIGNQVFHCSLNYTEIIIFTVRIYLNRLLNIYTIQPEFRVCLFKSHDPGPFLYHAYEWIISGLPPVSALFYGTFTFMHFCRFRHQFGVFGTAFTRFGTVARFCTRYPLTMYFINILTRFGTYLSADIIL